MKAKPGSPATDFRRWGGNSEPAAIGFCGWGRKPAGQRGNRLRRGILLVCIFVFGIGMAVRGWSQPAAANEASGSSLEQTPSGTGADSLAQWSDLPVKSLSFEGVAVSRLDPLPDHLAQPVGAPLSPEKLKRSLRQLYATGLFEAIEVEGSRVQDGVALVFRGTPRTFIGIVTVEGAKGANVNTQLERASQLDPGTRYTPAKLNLAIEQMRITLALNGFHSPVITQKLTPHPDQQLIDIAFHVDSGPQARVGSVEVSGDPGMTTDEFSHAAHLRTGARVDHDTPNRALTGVLKHYRGEERLEAEIKLESEKVAEGAIQADFRFSANQGPRVKVLVEGAKMGPERIKHVIPIFEEGTVDEDLLNEGNRRVRDYYQRLGYFDVKVDHERKSEGPDRVVIVYRVRLGPRRRVEKVSVTGNHYFDSATLKDLLSVHAADTLDRHGAYSQALVNSDLSALETLYQNNGFSRVKITPETSTPETSLVDASAPTTSVETRNAGMQSKIAPLTLVYHIEEGPQMRVGSVRLNGNDHVDAAKLTPLLNTTAGQLFSPRDLAGDRNELLTDYLSRGFLQAQVDVTQQVEQMDQSKTDVVFHITEGEQIFVRNVLLTGLHFTRPSTVVHAITLHPGDPLNQSALLDTQRNFYDLALFSEVDTAVENPTGGETYKTILLQATEARRWALTYGFGFEAQTGTPQYNCSGIIASGAICNPNGKTGVSPRVLASLTRNNLFGREHSASVQGNYGLLEQKINLLYQIPHFQGDKNFGLDFSAGYANSLDVTTYVASKLEGSVRWTEHFNNPGSRISKANTFVYQLNFRRVKVEASSLQVAPGEIAALSTAQRVGGPSLTWIRDTRDSALDARRGTYTSFQEFLSHQSFGAQVDFNRIDVSNSSYYGFDKGRFVVARNTRYGQERAFGTPYERLIPLPERLYAGGATSLRGFPQNAAGPRDPETGYPIGGAGALANSTELRLPPPTLPWVGNTISVVLFHDMGNVFTNAGDAWASAIRSRQPDRDTCKVLTVPASTSTPPGPVSSTGWQGQCNFNYFSHALGTGLRYHTPAGPIRFDFSYNLNTPIYPVIYNYSLPHPASAPYVGEANHFNFFFSLGQTF